MDPNGPHQIRNIIDNAALDEVILLIPYVGRKRENIVMNSRRIKLVSSSITLTVAATGSPVRVDGDNAAMSENVSRGNSLVGIRVTSTGHKLSKKKSGGTDAQNNGSCQHVFAPLNSDGGPNTSSNNAAFTFTAPAGGNSPAG